MTYSYDIVPPILNCVLSEANKMGFCLVVQYIAAVPTNPSCSLLKHLFYYSPETLI